MQEPTHFLTVRELAESLSSGEITSVQLTQMYLDRAAELDPPPFDLPSEPRPDHEGQLSTMVTIAREHALESAERAECCVADLNEALHLPVPPIQVHVLEQ
jgi:Asp-tRNA(Asn)/Glu-tRNA(Gln) amidotransferase A subunit family amidase